MSDNFTYFIEYFAKLFALLSPLVIIPLFISVAAPLSKAERIKAAKMGSVVALFAMLVSALAGRKVLALFGIGLGSLYVGGGIIIFMMGVSMLNATDVGDQEVDEGTLVGQKKKIMASDISIVPLGIPIICGPCCITSVIAYQSAAKNSVQYCYGICALVLVSALVYLMLVLCAHGAKWLTPNVLKLSYKLTGIILVMMAIGMVFKGLRQDDLQVLQPLEALKQQTALQRKESFCGNARSFCLPATPLSAEICNSMNGNR